jgi:hypothetical protein
MNSRYTKLTQAIFVGFYFLIFYDEDRSESLMNDMFYEMTRDPAEPQHWTYSILRNVGFIPQLLSLNRINDEDDQATA